MVWFLCLPCVSSYFSPDLPNTTAVWLCPAGHKAGKLLEKLKTETGGTWWLPFLVPPRWNVGVEKGRWSANMPSMLQWRRGTEEGREKGPWQALGPCSSCSWAQPPTLCCSLNQLPCCGLPRSGGWPGEMPVCIAFGNKTRLTRADRPTLQSEHSQDILLQRDNFVFFPLN